MIRHYYSEWEEYPATWLENLIRAGLLPPGDVDRRSIEDVRPDDLKGYTSCHFFAGVGGWPLAARLAGWDDADPIWTGSCPCQDFSAAGEQKGFEGERDLWPVWDSLIEAVGPSNISGEQVERAIEFGWLDRMLSDLESKNYAGGPVVLPACSVGAPHRRYRLWFVAHRNGKGSLSSAQSGIRSAEERSGSWNEESERLCGRGDGNSGMAHAESDTGRAESKILRGGYAASGSGSAVPLGDAYGQWQQQQGGIVREGGRRSFNSGEGFRSVDQSRAAGLERHAGHVSGGAGRPNPSGSFTAPGLRREFWDDYQWIAGGDGKARRVVTNIRSVADGLPERMAGLCAEYYQDAAERIIYYAEETEQRPREILRKVWDKITSQNVWQKPRGFWGIQEKEILLPYLRELDRRINDGWIPCPSAEAKRDVLRMLRIYALSPFSPQERKCFGQQTEEYTDPLCLLSQILAFYAEQAFDSLCGDAPIIRLLEEKITCRKQKISCFGNAIVPQQGAEVIQILDEWKRRSP